MLCIYAYIMSFVSVIDGENVAQNPRYYCVLYGKHLCKYVVGADLIYNLIFSDNFRNFRLNV